MPEKALPRAVQAVAALLFAALFFFGVHAPAASAAAGIDVTVNVTTKSGAPLAGLKLYAYPVENHAVIGDGIVGDYISGKTYSIELTTLSDYALYFDAPSSATTAFDQFWGGTTFVEEARYWDYTADGTTLNVTLATNSTLTGKVKSSSGSALSGVAVYPWRWDGNGWFRLDAAKVTTASTGVYTMRNLEPGTYRVEFAPSNTTGYLSKTSGPLTVGLGATVTSNASLSAGGSISGKVRLFMAGDEYLPYGVTAYAYPVDPLTDEIDVLHVYPSKVTGNSGAWTIKGLPSGRYKVKLYDTDTSAFVDVWAKNGTTGVGSVADATEYSVTAGKTTATSGTPRLIFYNDLPDTSLVITAKNAGGSFLGTDSTLYIESLSGEDFYFQSDSQFGFQNGVLSLPFMPVGDYRVWIDPADTASQPYIADTWHIAAQAGGNAWTIQLASRTDFVYSAQASFPGSTSIMGSTYTVNRGHTTLDDGSGAEADVEYSYIWLRDDAPIFGSQSSTSDSYTTRGADQGHKISVIVRADAFGFGPVFSTVVATNSVQQGPAANNTAIPVISGAASAVTGSVLSASSGSWSTGGLSFAYQWYRDYGSGPVAIPAATNRAYTATGADAGADLTVSVTAARTGYVTSAAAVSDAKPVGFLPAPKLVKAPAFAATTLTGGDVKLSTTSGTWSPVGTTYEYLWSADGVMIPGSAGVNPYICAASDCAGKAIQLQLNVYRLGYDTATKYFVVRKGTATPVQTDAAAVVDATDGNAPITGGSFAQIGHTLKAIPQVYSYPSNGGTVTSTYQWYANGAAISGATKQTYVPTKSVLNKVLTVRITVSNSLYPSGTATGVPAGTARYLQDLVEGPHPSVSIDGTGLAGTIKRVLTSGNWPVGGVTQSYQWFRCDENTVDCSAFPGNWTTITGATASTYTPPFATSPAGTLFAARVTGSKSGYQSFTLLTSALGITNSDLNDVQAFTTPTYASGLTGGNATVSKPVVVKQGTLDRTADVTRVLQWQVCNDASCSSRTDIAGATSASYTPAATLLADGNPHWIRFTELIKVNGGNRIQLLTTPVPVVAANWAAVKAPAVTSVGGQYTVNTGTWPAGVTPAFAYQWHDGTTSTTTGNSVTPSAGTTPIWVTVTAKRPGYVDLTYTLVARKGTLPAQTPALTGTAYGDTLSLAGPLTIPVNVPAAALSYQWYSGSTAISGATKATFVPSTAYVGKSLTVRVKVTSAFYATTTVVSSAVVLAKHAASGGTPAMVSTPNTFAAGAKLSASLPGYASGMTYVYSWELSPDGVAPYVRASSTSTYVLPSSAIGKFVRLTVTASRTGWNSVTRSTTGVEVGFTPGLTLTSPFVLSGTAKVDTIISAPTTWDTTGMTLSYSWTRNGVTIPGATGSSVVPTASWYGDEIQAHVTATKTGYQTKTVDSNEVRVGLGAAPTTGTITIARSGLVLTAPSPVWSVAGVTVTYRWYDQGTDPGHSSSLGSTATLTGVSGHTYAVVITAKRSGYEDGVATATTAVP